MMLKKAALAGASLLCLAHHAEAQNFNQLIAFGDSTTDTGWFANASVGVPGNPFAEFADQLIKNSLANGGNAHFTGPGPGNAQILGSFFGLPANPANTPGGTNYAIGGAFNDAILGPGLENLFSTTFGQANTNLPGTDRQIGNYLASVNGHANPNALYLISSGGNNAFYASMTFGSDAAAANAAFLLPEAQALANAVAQLQQAGARYIIVANQYQPPSADANAVIYGNTVINATFADLTRAGVKFITANTASVIAAVEQNPLAFGITAPISSNACNFPGFTRNIGGVTCANTTTPPPPNPMEQYAYLVSADATRTHLYVDGTHLSEAGQIIVANYYDSLLTQRWDGTTTVGDGPVNNANLTANGGNGIWNNTSTNWATSIGTVNSAWNGISAVFGGAPGTVTIAEPIAYQSMQFSTGGYLLTASAGGTLMPTGVAPIIVDSGLAATIAASITGSGGMDKNGLGTLILTGDDTYSGPTNIDGGTLDVEGSIASSSLTTLNRGGTLTGIGTVGMTTIMSGGTLAPGNAANPTGTLTVAGSLAFQSGAFYLVQVAGSTSSITNVTGTASLAGTVLANVNLTAPLTKTYDILHSGGLGDTTFNGLVVSDPNFLGRLSYSADDVFLNLTAQLGAGANLTQNQRNVAGAVNNFFNSGGTLPPIFGSFFGLTGASLANALEQTSGEAATGAQQAAFQLGSQFLNVMLDPFVDGRCGIGGTDYPPLSYPPDCQTTTNPPARGYFKAPPMYTKAPPVYEPHWAVWGTGFGGGSQINGDPVIGSHDLSARTAGFATGFDYRLAPNSVVGFALAGGGTNWSLSQGLGGGRSDALQAGIYGATRWGPAYFAADFAFTNHWMSTDRFAFLGDHLTADFNAQSYGGRFEGGYRFATPFVGIAPYAAIQAQSFHTPSYSEIGTIPDGFALAFGSRDASDTRSELGARFDRVLAVYPDAVLALRGRVAWAHDWVSDPTLTPLFESLPGASFVVNGAALPHDSALTSVGAELRFANGIALLAKFDGDFASRSSTYAGTGTIRYTW